MAEIVNCGVVAKNDHHREKQRRLSAIRYIGRRPVIETTHRSNHFDIGKRRACRAVAANCSVA